ncbi:hypothetical protein FJZ55_09140 [Candidatus Woesearchaeota archaeon]|nr:hypothetical protein [Candidatus Woesearchaeota archaeon]
MSTIKTNTIQPINASDSLKIRTNDLDSLTVTSSGDITVRGSFVGNTIQPISGSDSLKIRTNDLDSLTVTSSGDITVRGALNVDSGTLFVDAASNRVGIGTSTPAVALDVNGEARSSTSTSVSSHAKTLVTKDFVDFSVDPFVLTIDDAANADRLSSSAPGSTVVRTSDLTVTQANATTIRVQDLRIGRVHTRVHRTVSSATPNYQPFTAWYIDNTNAVSLVWTAFYTTGNSTTFSGSLSTNLTMTPLTVMPYNSTPHYFAGSMHTGSTYGYSVVWVLRIG